MYNSKKNKAISFLFVFTFILPFSLSAITYQVPSLGTNTIAEAMLRTRPGDTIWVDEGTYREHVLLAPGVSLISRSTHRAIIDGRGKGTVVTMGKGCTVSGFEIRNGTIGVFSNGANNTISSCRIIKNWQTGIVAVRNLPRIEDNIIAFNRGSGLQGWDTRATNATVNHNTIAYNGNNGVSFGGKSELILENNVIAFNERLGLKIHSNGKRIQVTNNNFYRNLMSPRPIPSGNFSFDPAFLAPRSSLNFRADPSRCCEAKGTDNQELGTRVTY